MNSKISILNFLKDNKISWFPVNLSLDGKEKIVEYSKFYNAMPKQNDFKNFPDECINRQKYIDDHNSIAIDTRDFIHIDVDFEDDKFEAGAYHKDSDNHISPAQFVQDLISGGIPYYKSLTKKHGKHFIIEKNGFKFPSLRPQTIYEDIEILAGQWAWINKKSKIRYTDTEGGGISDTDGFFKTILQNEVPDEGVYSGGECDVSDGCEELEQVVNNISLKFIEKYDSWTRLVWGLKNGNNNNYELAKKMSMRSSKFDLDFFNKLWENSRSAGCSIGTVNYYSRKSNEKNYFKIKAQGVEIRFLESDATLANIYLDNSSLDHVFKNNVLYTYNRGTWSVDDKCLKITHKIQQFCHTFVNAKTNLINSKISDALSQGSCPKGLQDDKDKLNKIAGNILNYTKSTHIAKCAVIAMSCMDYDNVEFDKNPNLFTFKNKSVNLNTGENYKTRREDYILTCCDYDYIESTGKQLNELERLINQIFPDSDIKKNYIHYLSTGLFGKGVEKFVMANGSGGNGKGVINELMLKCLSNYGYTAPNQILLNPMKTGSNPEVANMSGKRLIIYREPDSEKFKLNGSVIKELTGGDAIAARMNYSNNMEVVLVATHILECNKKPKIDGKIDESYTRRLVDIPFKSTFTSDEDILTKELDNVYRGNTHYKSKEFKDEYKTVLFDYLLEYIKSNQNPCDNLYICKEVKERTMEYLQDSDEIYGVISPIVQKTDDKDDYVVVKDLYQVYKSTDYYLNLSKKSKRDNNLKWFHNEISSNLNYRNYYKEKHRPYTTDGKQAFIRNVLLYHKIVKDENESEFINDELD